MTQTNPEARPAGRADDRSTAELISEVTRLVPKLAREEVELAKAELVEKGKHAGIGVGAFGGAGLVALFGAGTLVAAAVLGLAEAVPAWLSAVIVGAVLLILAGILTLVGKSQLGRATPPLPEHAVESTKQDVETVKESAHR